MNEKLEMGFWKKLKKPFFVLAPMADVTDPAFRRLIAKRGRPDVFWTEFVSADGLCSQGRKVLLKNLAFSRKEKPIVAQLFSSKPEKMRVAAKICERLGFDGVDINMGCPDRSIEKQGAGASLMKNADLAVEIIRAAKESAPSLPVSVKTRIGYNKNEIGTWIRRVLEEGVAALTVHCRTRKELSLVPARWEHMKEVVVLRDKISPKTLVIGNGDVLSIEDAKVKAREFGVDGVMLGRAIFGNPWLFSSLHGKPIVPSHREKLVTLVEHTKYFEKLLRGVKNFAVMKKHYKSYVNGFDGAKEFRMELMKSTSAKEVEKKVKDFLKRRKDIK